MATATGNSKFLVFTNPVEGKEAEYNDWYDNIHLGEVVSLDGIISAQRFRITAPQMINDQPFRYLAIYEIEKGREADVLKSLESAAEIFNMQPVIDMEKMHAQMVESITDAVS